MRPSSTTCLMIASTAALYGCATERSEYSEHAAASCQEVDTRSVLENDPAVVNDERFSLARVLETIRATTPRSRDLAVPDVREMYASLFDAFGTCAGSSVDPRRYGLACRTAEQALGAQDPFTGAEDALHFEPVAVVNRFDLAGKTHSSCGESRIVYWKDRGPGAGTAGFIVELSTPPVIARGRRTCAPIVQFWASLSQDHDSASRAAKLERFFFEGLPGMPYAPVSARGAGWDGQGQLRSNNFADAVQWNLREAKWQQVCERGACSARFVIAATKGSPSDRLFAGTHGMAGEFASWFVDNAVPKLAAAATFHDLSLGNAAKFDAYESISQPRAGDPSSVLYAQVASASLRTRITDKLAAIGSPLGADDILHRATAVTCAGCHRVSRNANLGGGMMFPPPVGFAHVGADGVLSPAMTDHLLPRRLEAFQALACAPPQTSDAGAAMDTQTISGRGLGAHH